jgi:citrate lyase subunit beta / citryl-CoA lyase
MEWPIRMLRPAMKLRTALFAPGDSARKAEKAIASAADAVILDLEDSVSAPGKPAAREASVGVLRATAGRSMIVRVNQQGTDWYLADLAAVVPAAPAAVMLPKCTGPADLVILDHHLSALEVSAGLTQGTIGVVAIVTETAASIFTLGAYAGAPRLVAMCFGAEDLAADLGVTPRLPDGSYPAATAAARAAVLAGAAAAGVPALDTPWPDPRDPAGLTREAAAAAADGFSGKLLIHPDQIGPVQAMFTPSAERLRWAERVRDAFAHNPDAGVFALDGKMIDRPHLRLAQRILDSAG